MGLSIPRNGGAPPNPEPPHVTRAFTEDPIGAARQALVDEVATLAGGEHDDRPVRRRARMATGLDVLASASPEDEVVKTACSDADGLIRDAAEMAAGDIHEVAAKMALLVQQIARHDLEGVGSSNDHLRFVLASCVLADLVILGHHPPALPDRALRPIVDQADVEHWRQRAAGRAS